MLVLSRKENETIIISEGDNAVVVSILAINGNRVTLGVQAPREIKIMRSELVSKEMANG